MAGQIEESADAIAALESLIYEVTHLSETEEDGSHICKISAMTLNRARATLKSLRGADQLMNAAPAMLRALKYMIEAIDFEGPEGSIRFCPGTAYESDALQIARGALNLAVSQ